ncbi:response regulator transcription factor [Streptomyces sp. NPDC020607]|uniref:response regulator transcription factor n=1 Tax=Streptomyces sp. NPDC020607 TaxID=3365082 RepID=UPI00379FD393
MKHFRPLHQYMLTAVDELDLPLTPVQVRQLTNRVILKAARQPSPRGAAFELPPRQYEVLLGAACGERGPETARRLGLNHNTVKQHAHRLNRKLGTATTAQSVAVAITLGLIRLPDPMVPAHLTGGAR